jgi:hypothetical protein
MLLGRAAGLTGGQLQSLDPSSMRGYFKLTHPIFSGTSLSDSIPALLPAYQIINTYIKIRPSESHDAS